MEYIYKDVIYNPNTQDIEFVQLSEKEISNLKSSEIAQCALFIDGLYYSKSFTISLKHFKQKNRLFYDERYSSYSLFLGELNFPYDITTQFFKFNYNIERLYSAQKHLRLFKANVELPKVSKTKEVVKYTFGIEYETSNGHLPQNVCYKNGLIPLRDGSIGANEYATIVMKGNSGLQLIKEQTASLNRYTSINSDCSTHIHFGKTRTETEFIFFLYQVLYNLQDQFETFLPKWTFHTGEYKKTGKDYCNKLPKLNSFMDLYCYLDPNKKSFVDIFQCNSLDEDGKHKWQIPGRYHWVNFVNLLFYNKNKTIEFRFLQPTTNYHKIINWIYILNAIILFCETKFDTKCDISNLTIEDVLLHTYDKKTLKVLFDFLNQLKLIKSLQEKMYDFQGKYRVFDDVLIRNNAFDEK